ncbi:MAG: MFS transporter [Terriglobia bacterium]|jgi:DHA1 family purine base/nucleoside efflux pump-like MFS transporter
MDSLVIANLFLLLFLGLADNQMIAALLPSLVKSLGISISTAGLLVVVYSLAAAVAAFFSGTLSDHYGRRRFLLAGGAFFAVASWAAAESRTLNELMLARALTGLAAGTLSTCSITFAADWFAYNVRGRAIGLISSAYFAAPILGVPIAALIADRFGWRRAFLFFAGLAVVVTLATLRLPRERLNPQPSTEKLRTAAQAFRSFLVRRDTAAALVIAFLVSGGLVGFLTYIGEWLNSSFGLPTRTIGWVFMLGGIVAVGSAPLGGILSDRWGKRAVSIASNILLAVAVAFVPFLPWGWGLLGVFGLASLSAAFRQGPLTALMTEMVPAAQRGSFIALRNISSQMGIGATAYLGGVLYQRSGYAAVTSLCAVMTAVVVILLATHIVEPRGAEEIVSGGSA